MEDKQNENNSEIILIENLFKKYVVGNLFFIFNIINF